MKYFGIHIALVLACLSCSGKQTSFVSEQEFQAYLNDPGNGFVQSFETGDFKFDAKLVPTLKTDKNNDITIQLRINRTDGGSVLDFGGVPKEEALQREGYLSFELKEQVYLECNDQIIPCSFHHYERNYGLKPSVDVFFNFSGVKPEKEVYFVYRDELFGQGLIRIKFNKELFTTCYVQQ